MTVQGVATRAGVNKTSVYRRWGTKPALLADALLSSTALVVPPDTGALRTDLFALWRTAPRGRERGDPSQTVAVSRALTASREPEVAEVHRLLWRQRLELVRTAVERAVIRGELHRAPTPSYSSTCWSARSRVGSSPGARRPGTRSSRTSWKQPCAPSGRAPCRPQWLWRESKGSPSQPISTGRSVGPARRGQYARGRTLMSPVPTSFHRRCGGAPTPNGAPSRLVTELSATIGVPVE